MNENELKKEQKKHLFFLILNIIWVVVWSGILLFVILASLTPLYIYFSCAIILFNAVYGIKQFKIYKKIKTQIEETSTSQEKLCPYFIDSDGSIHDEGY